MFLRHSALRDVLLLVLTVGSFFAFMLGSRPLSAPDEGRYTEIPREMLASGDFITPRLNGVKYFEKPPLMYWLTSGSLKLFGVQEGALRFWPAFLGLLTCLMVYGTGRALYGRRAGLLGAGVLGTSLLFYAHTRLLILDMAVSTFIVGALLSFLLATREKKGLLQRLYLGAFFGCAALAVLSKGLIGAVLPGGVILLWCALYRDGASLKLAFCPWGIALFLVLTVPWHVMVALRNPEFFHFYFVYEHFVRFLTTAHSRYQPFYFFVPIVLVGFFPWTGVLISTLVMSGRKIKGSFQQERDGCFILLAASFIFLFFSFSSSKLIPYILPVFPLMALMMGRHLNALYEARHTPLWAPFVGICVLLALGALGALWHQNLLAKPVLQLYGMVVMGILLSGAAFVFWKRHHIRATLGGMVVTGLCLLITLNGAWPHLENRSIKKLALEINKHKQPGDQVVAFGRYYQDLPPYVDQKIIVTDWKGELEFGMSVEDTRQWMMSKEAFRERVQKGGRFFLVTRKDFLDDLRKLGLYRTKVLAETSRDVVLYLEKGA